LEASKVRSVRILVTGGAGFIGSNLADELAARGHQVSILDNFSTGRIENLAEFSGQVFTGNVLDVDLVNDLVAKSEAVVHLAALGSVPRSIKEPTTSFSVNAIGTLNVVEAARLHGARVIFASSSAVYGNLPFFPRSEGMPTAPISPYAASKLAAESLVLTYAKTYNADHVVFRLFNVYGPRQRSDGAYAAVIPRFVNQALDCKSIQIHGTGQQSRDFTYVAAVVNIITRTIENFVTSESPLNLAFGRSTSILEIAENLELLLERKIELTFTGSRQSDVYASTSDPSMLLEKFPDACDRSFPDGLNATLSWYNSQGKYQSF
jgi:UDP-glucose 4-epimerase